MAEQHAIDIQRALRRARVGMKFQSWQRQCRRCTLLRRRQPFSQGLQHFRGRLGRMRKRQDDLPIPSAVDERIENLPSRCSPRCARLSSIGRRSVLVGRWLGSQLALQRHAHAMSHSTAAASVHAGFALQRCGNQRVARFNGVWSSCRSIHLVQPNKTARVLAHPGPLACEGDDLAGRGTSAGAHHRRCAGQRFGGQSLDAKKKHVTPRQCVAQMINVRFPMSRLFSVFV